MILPNRYVPPAESLLGYGALLLRHISDGKTVHRLWEDVRVESPVGGFDRFVLALDVLFLVGAVEFRRGRIERTS